MSRSTSRKTSTTQETASLDPWSRDRWQQQWDRVQSMMSNSPVQAYSGRLTAGLSDREQRGRGLFESNMGSFNPEFDRAGGMISNAGEYGDFGSVADRYMNPYERAVIDSTISDLNRMHEGQLNSARAQAAASGAYGGSRLGLMEAQLAADNQRLAADTIGRMRYEGFERGRSLYGEDINRRLQRAGMLADLAARRHDMNASDAMTLNELGREERGIEQDELDRRYSEFLRQQSEGSNRLGMQMNLLNAIPQLVNRNSRTTEKSVDNPGLIGSLGAIGGIASMFVPGGQLAGAPGMLMRLVGRRKPLAEAG